MLIYIENVSIKLKKKKILQAKKTSKRRRKTINFQLLQIGETLLSIKSLVRKLKAYENYKER